VTAAADARVRARVFTSLRCPYCRDAVRHGVESLSSLSCSACGATYPVIDGVPIMIDERQSGFRQRDALRPSRGSGLGRFLPEPSLNVAAGRNFERLARLAAEDARPAQVLVIGGRVEGKGFSRLASAPWIDLVETDVALGPRTQIACDAHFLPFADGSFDAVVLQAVLEHVLRPWDCVEEVHRVLRPAGYVYAETPFMQQVHASLDFTRFTLAGHRALWFRFDEIDAGIAVGPGSALAWAWEHFLGSIPGTPRGRRVARAVGRVSAFWFKYLDLVLARRPGAADAASCTYFLGRRREEGRSNRSMLPGRKGLS
jgi:SAM-dependent methyltransferase